MHDVNNQENHAGPMRFLPPIGKGCFIALLLGSPASVLAFDNDAFTLTTFAREQYDSNLFRLPDGLQPFNAGRRSATTQTAGLGLQVDKTYGLQRFDLSATVTRDQYEPYDYLNATGRTIGASWAWTLTPSLMGNLSINQTLAPNNFSDTGFVTHSNTRKTEERRFDVNYRPGAALHPRLSLLDSQDKSEQTTFVRQNSKTTSLEGALVYEFRTGNTTEIYFRRGRGNYIDLNADPVAQSDSQYLESETGVAAHWNWTGLSTLDGRIGYLDRDHRTFASRNFSGPVGQLSFTYYLTGKTSLQVNGSRTLGSTQTLISSYSEDETATIGPVWSATQKITVRPSYSVTRRIFKDPLVPVVEDLRLTQRDATLQVDWSVLRNFNLSLVVLKSNRSATDRNFQYSDRQASVLGRLNF